MGKTANAVKQKYNSRVYRQVKVSLSRMLVDAWEKQIEMDGTSKAEFIRSAMQGYLTKKNIVVGEPED